jgi:hypothetical protein
MSQCDVAKPFESAFVRVPKPQNAIRGFQSSGVWPYKSNIFSDTDHASGYVTDRPHAYIDFTQVYPTHPPQSEHNQLRVDEFHFPKLQRF